MPVTYREMLRILNDFSYEKFHQKGSHERWYFKLVYGVTVPHHDELLPATAKSILKDISEHQHIHFKTLIKKYNLKL